MFADVICRPGTADVAPLTLTVLSPTKGEHCPVHHQLCLADTGMNKTTQSGPRACWQGSTYSIFNFKYDTVTCQIEQRGNLLSIGDYMLTK